MASAVVIRSHINGNYTAGWYLVDLLCLGVKDTTYMFNITKQALDEKLAFIPLIEEAEYNLVHNIVYAAHDFALEFDIKPHKDFGITKYILEDDESVPLIEIPVGDEEGNPHLLVDRSYNYAPALQKLKLNAGEGNYTFTLTDDEFDEDGGFEDDDEFDYANFDGDEEFLDFHLVKGMSTQKLEKLMEAERGRVSELPIIRSELLLRDLDERENGVIEDFETLKETKDFKLFDNKQEQWQRDYGQNKEGLEKIFPLLNSISSNPDDLDDEKLMQKALKLVEKHKSDDMLSYMILNAVPLLTVLSQFAVLEEHFPTYSPAVQLFIAQYATLQNKMNDGQYNFIINASTVEMAYPFNRFIHGLHHKLFWLVKALHAYQQEDKEKLLYYHNLIRIAGTGGLIRYLYATQLVSWLSKYMGIEDEYMDQGEDEDEDE